MKRPRLLAALLLPTLAMVAAACGNSDDNSGSGTTEASVETTSAPVETTSAPVETTASPAREPGEKKLALVYDIGGRGDKSFNDAAAAGVDRAKAELAYEVKELEVSQGGENRQELLELVSDQGYPIVLAVGYSFDDAVTAAAATHPNVKYVQVDGGVEAPNVTELVFAEEEGSYVVGVAAALKSKTGHIGFIGGIELDLVKRFQAGYEAGAKSVNPNIVIDVKYLSQGTDFSGFHNPTKGKEAAKSMYDSGADVVFHDAGDSGSGLFDAAVEAGDGKWAIGVDSDQYLTATPQQQQHILTSMLKRVDVAVFAALKAHAEGTLKAGFDVFGLARDGVGYSTSGGYLDDIRDELEAARADIASGKIKVPTTVR